MRPSLIVFSGLPATGKTTLAREAAARLKACHLRIDTIEQGLRELCSFGVQGEGYRLAYRIAADNLLAGIDVIADCVNPWRLTRREWAEVASRAGSLLVNVEISCSDLEEHRSRAEKRGADIADFRLPSWREIVTRDYEAWTEERIVLETAGRTIAACVDELIRRIEGQRHEEHRGPVSRAAGPC
jgi:predicted kinase